MTIKNQSFLARRRLSILFVSASFLINNLPIVDQDKTHFSKAYFFIPEIYNLQDICWILNLISYLFAIEFRFEIECMYTLYRLIFNTMSFISHTIRWSSNIIEVTSKVDFLSWYLEGQRPEINFITDQCSENNNQGSPRST